MSTMRRSSCTGWSTPSAGPIICWRWWRLAFWRRSLGGRAVWALPVTFVGAMLAGGAMGAGGMGLPVVEPMILASVVILGVLVAMAARLPMGALVPMVAVFGAAHGWAHGAEGPATGLPLYAAGFALATMALHLGGIAFGRLLSRGLELRVLGGGTALAGLALTVA